MRRSSHNQGRPWQWARSPALLLTTVAGTIPILVAIGWAHGSAEVSKSSPVDPPAATSSPSAAQAPTVSALPGAAKDDPPTTLPEDPEPAPAPLDPNAASDAQIGADTAPVKSRLTFQENFSQGMDLSRQGNHREAIERFRAAYAIKPLPVLYLYLGLSYQKQGIIKVAVGYYKLYLRFETNIKPEIRAEVETYIKEQQARLDEEERAMRAVRESGGEAATDITKAGSGAPGNAATAALLTNPEGRDAANSKPVPIYKRWWLWGAIGGAVAVGVVAGSVAGTRPRTPEPPAGVAVIDLPWQ